MAMGLLAKSRWGLQEAGRTVTGNASRCQELVVSVEKWTLVHSMTFNTLN